MKVSPIFFSTECFTQTTQTYVSSMSAVCQYVEAVDTYVCCHPV